MCPGGVRPLAMYTPSSSQSNLRNAALVARSVSAALVVSISSAGRVVAKKISEHSDVDLRSADLRQVHSLVLSTVAIRTELHIPKLLLPSETLCEEIVVSLIQGSVLSIDNTLVVDTDDQRLLADAVGWELLLVEKGKKKRPKPVAKAPILSQLLLPLGSSSPENDDHVMHRAEMPVRISGSMYAEAIVMQESTLGNALTALREDACRSLRTRLQLLRESEDDERYRQAMSIMPARVVARPKTGSRLIPMTEHILEGETIENDVLSRFVEVLSWSETELGGYEILQVENFADVEPCGSGPMAVEAMDVNPKSMRALDVAAKAPMAYMYQALMAAVVVAILAIAYKIMTES